MQVSVQSCSWWQHWLLKESFAKATAQAWASFAMSSLEA